MTKNTSSRSFLPNSFSDKDFIGLYGKKGANNYKKITVGCFYSTNKEHIGTDEHLLGSVELMIKDDSMFIAHRVCSLDSNGYFNG